MITSVKASHTAIWHSEKAYVDGKYFFFSGLEGYPNMFKLVKMQNNQKNNLDHNPLFQILILNPVTVSMLQV